LKGLQADQELEIWILFDLLNQFLIREPHARLDDQGPLRHAEGLCRYTKSLAELGCMVVFQIIPWNQPGQPDPAVVAREFSSKRQQEIFK
jgi:hypothetical protein